MCWQSVPGGYPGVSSSSVLPILFHPVAKSPSKEPVVTEVTGQRVAAAGLGPALLCGAPTQTGSVQHGSGSPAAPPPLCRGFPCWFRSHRVFSPDWAPWNSLHGTRSWEWFGSCRVGFRREPEQSREIRRARQRRASGTRVQHEKGFAVQLSSSFSERCRCPQLRSGQVPD